MSGWGPEEKKTSKPYRTIPIFPAKLFFLANSYKQNLLESTKTSTRAIEPTEGVEVQLFFLRRGLTGEVILKSLTEK